jgi:hypothetical protein
MRQAREPAFSTGAGLHVGSRDHYGQPHPEGIDADGALAALDLGVGLIAVDPPGSVVVMDWLARLPALGWRGRPAATRPAPRRRSGITVQVPSVRHGPQSSSPVRQGGRSCGSMRQEHPVRRRSKIPWRISRVG